MRAFVLDAYGAIPDHVRLANIADPVAGPDEVLIAIPSAPGEGRQPARPNT